jgi:hypothetical protein
MINKILNNLSAFLAVLLCAISAISCIILIAYDGSLRLCVTAMAFGIINTTFIVSSKIFE